MITLVTSIGKKHQTWVCDYLYLPSITDRRSNSATLLTWKLKEAILQAEEYDEYHKDWAMTFSEKAQSQYYKELEAWENDGSLPNPFVKTSMSKPLQCLHSHLY
jgi:hypothetical protein